MNNQNHRWINLCSRKLIDVHLEDALPQETSLNIWPDFFSWGADASLHIAREKICFSCQPEVPCRRSWTRNKQQVPFHILGSAKKTNTHDLEAEDMLYMHCTTLLGRSAFLSSFFNLFKKKRR